MNCPGCGVKPGNIHKPGCGIEICPVCGGQALMCLSSCPACKEIIASCQNEHVKENQLIPWSGKRPGKSECEEYDFYCKWVEGFGWVQCDKNDPGAIEDLNRLHSETNWDREQKRYVKRS